LILFIEIWDKNNGKDINKHTIHYHHTNPTLVWKKRIHDETEKDGIAFFCFAAVHDDPENVDN